jgi:hypothetical protein
MPEKSTPRSRRSQRAARRNKADAGRSRVNQLHFAKTFPAIGRAADF